MFADVAFYVYMLASGKNGTLYIGSTDDLIVRISQHKEGLTQGFTSRYGIKILVWHELHDTRDGAFRRERQMKEWKRAWKVRLIEKRNLEWRDLYDELVRGDIPEPLFAPLIPTPTTPLNPPPITPLIPAKAGTQDRSEPGWPQEDAAAPPWKLASPTP